MASQINGQHSILAINMHIEANFGTGPAVKIVVLMFIYDVCSGDSVKGLTNCRFSKMQE